MSQETPLFRWYFGGLAGAGAVLVTHPMDLVKVHLRTEKPEQSGLIQHTKHLVKTRGFQSLYRGLPIAVTRQVVFNTPMFGLYQVAKRWVAPPCGSGIPYWQRTGLAASSGFVGGLLGAPLENLTVKMQMQARVAKVDRLSLPNVVLAGGMQNLFQNSGLTAARKALVAVGGMGGYDQMKLWALDRGAEDSSMTHALCGLAAGATATVCQMIVPGVRRWMEFRISARLRERFINIVVRGFIPSFARLGPQTSLTFVFLEQLRLNFGLVIYEQ